MKPENKNWNRKTKIKTGKRITGTPVLMLSISRIPDFDI